MRYLSNILESISFYIAQVYRFLPFNYSPFISRTLQPWCRWKPKYREKPFRAGLGYLLSPRTDNLFYISGLHEAQYLRRIHSRLQAGSLLIDIGANTGTSVLWLHFRNPSSQLKFIAIEALPDNAELLRENILLNPTVDCTVIEVASASFEGELEFASAGIGDGSAHVISTEVEIPGRQRHFIKATRLDTVVLDNSVKPAFLLIDVEGYAEDVLKGATKTLEYFKPDVGLEIHSEQEHRGSEAILFRLGYYIVWESFHHGHHRIYTYKK